MGIAQKVARDFADAVRARGQSYHAKGRVSLISSMPDAVTARVRGTAQYRVKLRIRGINLFASCTCPYFGPTGEPCKHLWATILMADSRSLLSAAPVRPLRLVSDLPRRQREGNGPVVGPAVGPARLPGPGSHAQGRPQSPKQRGRGTGPGRGGVAPKSAPHPRGRRGGKVIGPAQVSPPPRVSKRPQLIYVLDVPATLTHNQVVVDLARRQRRPGGDWGPPKPWWYTPFASAGRLDPEDHLLLVLLEAAEATPSAVSNGASPAGPDGTPIGRHRYILRPERQADLVERLGRTGRLRIRRTDGEDDPPTSRWDDGPPWRFWIDIRPDPSGKRWTWRGQLRRGEGRMDLAEPLVLLPGLLILGSGRAARFDDAGVFLWMARLRHEKELVLSESQQDTMLSRILAEARVAPSELVETLRLVEVDLSPQPCLTVRTPRQNWGSDHLLAELEFDYESARVPAFPAGRVAVQTGRRRAIRRDVAAELAARELLEELGFREAKNYRVEPGTMELPPKRMAQATRDLVQAGWWVEAEGKLIRPAGEFKLSVATGIDWFELKGNVDFGGQGVSLPEVLAAAGRGETMVALSDGSIGMLPEEWLKKYGLLAELGSSQNGHLRFSRAQAGLLDALLAAQPGIRFDAGFGAVRQQLHSFEGVRSLKAPAGFQGELRPYQCEGLGWLDFLQKFGFGGILADDMGLGKTVQVLALLQRRKATRQEHEPSLIVVPRSLVFNWFQEAARFTPKLRLLEYTGTGRHPLRERFGEYDVVLTTYGTMRTDIAVLNQIGFDYVILDEAQSIKNSDSQSAKAARLLCGRNRLAMSGTPIENHLGELWSIVEFLNPGMLGSASVFKRLVGGGTSAGLDDQAKLLLARALRPFILRRTKGQVVKDLPEKTEQTLHCDMEPAQRRCYEELRTHYRRALLQKGSVDLRKSKIEVLEALLRLRQAACHPGLIDPDRTADRSAKLDMLLPQLAEVVEEGHKVLVFSQFTSFLAIVRERLEREGLVYEYLDGRTRNRAERVERFQTDADCPVFLISLKAGGLGLNLTAAEYVYLLDPWWNPAVEAQAIDRTHRIGQTRRVFAYRLICRDTVEQKILELQDRKRDLADAILNADNRLIRTLTRDDLEFLLS
jgi:SNF2-related domain/Helicase conserved C-terminal domain/SWIM zinc finger